MRFADVDGLGIAWQQFGSGPDCLVIPPLVSNIELQWEHEFHRRGVLEFQGGHLRITHFDKRGIGLSDRIDRIPSLEERIDDIPREQRWTWAGLERCHLFGISEGGLMAQLFAARHPERVDRLIVGNSIVGGFPITPEEEATMTANFERVATDWGRDGSIFRRVVLAVECDQRVVHQMVGATAASVSYARRILAATRERRSDEERRLVSVPRKHRGADSGDQFLGAERRGQSSQWGLSGRSDRWREEFWSTTMTTS